MNRRVFLLQEVILNYRIPFLNALAQQTGIDLALVTCPLSRRLQADAFREADQEMQFKTFLLPVLSETPFQYLFALISLLISERPDVVITVLGHSVLYALAILKVIFRFKLVLWHGGVPYRDPAKIEEYVRKIDTKKMGLPTFRSFLRNCDRFVLYSDHAKTFFREYFFIPEGKMFVAPNSPDTQLYQNVKERIAFTSGREIIRSRYCDNENKMILTVGRLNKQRRLDLLLKAYKKIRDEYPHVSFVIIGDGPEKPGMEKLSLDMGLQDVFFVGEIYNDRELAKYYACACIYAYSGVASLALKIAMTMGVPVVGFDYGLEVHAIQEGITGFVVPFGDWEALASRVLFLLKNEDRREVLSTAAGKVIRDGMNLDSMVKGFVATIENC